MKRLAAVTLWILAGAALTGGVYWAFLNTPESTIWTLMLSAALAVASVALLAITVNGAVAGWSSGMTPGSIRHAVVRIPAIVPALVIVLALWWVVGRTTGWVSAHSGEINAWFIARLGWAAVSALFTTIDWVGWWVRWILAPMIALSLLAAVIGSGWTAVTRSAWLERAAALRRLAPATLWFLLLIAAPWMYLATWRPAGMPATSIEMIFIASKLAVTAVLMATGVSLIIREGSRS